MAEDSVASPPPTTNPAQAVELTPDLEANFRKRSAAYRDFLDANPEATLKEIAAYRQKIKPQDPAQAKLFARWCVQELKKELVKE